MVIGQTGEHLDLVVVGGGPGGYAAAIRAAQLGKRVVVVERGAIGGVCLNQGCIPSKALLSAARLAARAGAGAAMGVDARVSVDFGRMQAWKRGVVERLAGGVRALLERWGVRVVVGTARFAGERRVVVDRGGDVTFFEFDAAVLATGSRAVVRGGLSPEAALELEALPGRLVVVGGNGVAVELATAFARLGSAVMLLSSDDALVPELEEPLLSRSIAGGLRGLGVEVARGVQVTQVEDGRVAYAGKEGAAVAEGDVVFDAAARAPNTDDLSLELPGVRRAEDGRVRVDAQQRTSAHHIFAVGDVTPGPLVAHRALAEGRVAAEAAAGWPSAMDATVPLVYFTEPEVLAVGLSEQAARRAGVDALVARFPLAASGRALTLGENDGFVQIVAERSSGRVIGVQAAGPGATEIAGEAALAIEMTATLEDLALTLHPHPTIAESFVEASELALGRPRHVKGKM